MREVKNVIERAMILSNSDELLPIHLPHEIAGQMDNKGTGLQDPWEQWLHVRPVGPFSLEEVTGRVEQYLVRWALQKAKYNRNQTIELLGLAKVDQLRYLTRKYGIE